MADLFDVFQIITFISSLTCSILLLWKDKKYLGNKLMAGGILGFAIYPMCIFLYDEIATDIAVQTFLRISLMASLVGITLIYFSIQCIVKTSFWFEKKANWFPYVIIEIIYLIYLIAIDFIDYTNTSDGGINVTTDLIPTGIFAITVLYFLLTSLYYVNKEGIKKTEGIQQKKMKIVFVGFIITIFAVLATVLSQFPIFSEEVGNLLDYLFFLLLAASLVVITFGFVKQDK